MCICGYVGCYICSMFEFVGTLVGYLGLLKIVCFMSQDEVKYLASVAVSRLRPCLSKVLCMFYLHSC